MNQTSVVLLAAALGSGGILTYLAQELLRWVRGRTGQESSAWIERDKEAKARRILEEYVHDLRRQVHDCGDTPIDWPHY